jgi:hypothetical protein
MAVTIAGDIALRRRYSNNRIEHVVNNGVAWDLLWKTRKPAVAQLIEQAEPLKNSGNFFDDNLEDLASRCHVSSG